MPRKPSFKEKKTPRGWMVSCPPGLSESGKRERVYFSSRDKAQEHAKKLRTQCKEHGEKAHAIKPCLAEDATKAAEVLEPFGVSLTQAAHYFRDQHDMKAKAPTLAEAWTAGIERRQNHRPRYLSDLRAWERALPKRLMAMNCHDITAEDIKKALDKVTDGPTRWRNGLGVISAILGDIAKDGKIKKNPARAVHLPRKANHEADVSTYSPDELQSLFNACKDYDDKRDRLCAACAVPFAIMAFAGIRPDEVNRLKWEDVSLELHNIRIGARTAKKAWRRNVRINDTLAAWLETVPKADRKGEIAPPRFKHKAARVRREAGIDGREKQDALRHSFGTYLLAVENDLDALKMDMGHRHVSTYFAHYHKAVTKNEALPYWRVLPAGVELPELDVVRTSDRIAG